MNKKEIIDYIIKNVEIGIVNKNNSNGGQSVGMINRDIYLKSQDTDFYIEIGYTKSQLKNKQIALDLFELYLLQIIK